MAEKQLQDLFTASMDGLKKMIDISTVVGDPITTPDGTTIIPYSRVSFGYGMGGANLNENDIGGGSGGGVTVTPIGFLIISKGETKMINVDSMNPVERLIESAPDIIDSITDIFKK
ncbi:MAG: sporulation protein YtfJ [Clostridia bacterium]|nr:sporulation protein YtfJ [Clostridia bacterium]